MVGGYLLPNPTDEELRKWIAWGERLLALPDEQLKVEAHDYMDTHDLEAIRRSLANDVEGWGIYLDLGFNQILELKKQRRQAMLSRAERKSNS